MCHRPTAGRFSALLRVSLLFPIWFPLGTRAVCDLLSFHLLLLVRVKVSLDLLYMSLREITRITCTTKVCICITTDIYICVITADAIFYNEKK